MEVKKIARFGDPFNVRPDKDEVLQFLRKCLTRVKSGERFLNENSAHIPTLKIFVELGYLAWTYPPDEEDFPEIPETSSFPISTHYWNHSAVWFQITSKGVAKVNDFEREFLEYFLEIEEPYFTPQAVFTTLSIKGIVEAIQTYKPGKDQVVWIVKEKDSQVFLLADQIYIIQQVAEKNLVRVTIHTIQKDSDPVNTTVEETDLVDYLVKEEGNDGNI